MFIFVKNAEVMKIFLVIGFCFLGILSFAQQQNGRRNIIWMCNGERMDSNLVNWMDPADLAGIDIIKTPETLAKMGYEGVEGVIDIQTKPYQNRPDSLRDIPTLKSFRVQDGKLYRDGVPYAGPYVEYYISGRLKSAGRIVNGLKEGWISTYYSNGNVKRRELWNMGNRSENFVSYYVNGQPEECYLPEQGEKVRKAWYSDGRLKFVAHKTKEGWRYNKKWSRLNKYLEKGKEYQKVGELENAEEYFTKATAKKYDCSDAFLARAVLRIEQKRFDEAVADMTTAIELDPYRMELFGIRADYRLRRYLGDDYVYTCEVFDGRLPTKVKNAAIQDLVKSCTGVGDSWLHGVIYDLQGKRPNFSPVSK